MHRSLQGLPSEIFLSLPLDSAAHDEAKQDHNGAVCLMLLGDETDVTSVGSRDVPP